MLLRCGVQGMAGGGRSLVSQAPWGPFTRPPGGCWVDCESEIVLPAVRRWQGPWGHRDARGSGACPSRVCGVPVRHACKSRIRAVLVPGCRLVAPRIDRGVALARRPAPTPWGRDGGRYSLIDATTILTLGGTLFRRSKTGWPGDCISPVATWSSPCRSRIRPIDMRRVSPTRLRHFNGSRSNSIQPARQFLNLLSGAPHFFNGLPRSCRRSRHVPLEYDLLCRSLDRRWICGNWIHIPTAVDLPSPGSHRAIVHERLGCTARDRARSRRRGWRGPA
jgi:hypothetical protein